MNARSGALFCFASMLSLVMALFCVCVDVPFRNVDAAAVLSAWLYIQFIHTPSSIILPSNHFLVADLSFHPREPSTYSPANITQQPIIHRHVYRAPNISSSNVVLPTSRKTPRRASLMTWCRFCVSDGRFPKQFLSRYTYTKQRLCLYTYKQSLYMSITAVRGSSTQFLSP